MSGLAPGFGGQARALREAFDRGFAQPQRLDRPSQHDLVGFGKQEVGVERPCAERIRAAVDNCASI